MSGYAAPETGYTMPAPGFTSVSGLRGPESCGGRSRGSGGSSNKSLTWSEIRETLRGATADLVGDLTQEIRAKFEPPIPPQGSPTTMGASPQRLQVIRLEEELPPAPQPNFLVEPPFAFPLTSAMGRAQWPHLNTAIIHVPHGSHLTLLLIYQRCYQKMVNAYGPWGPTWPPLEEKEASLKKVSTLNGYKNPGVDVWCAKYRAWDHYSLRKHTRAGSHGPRSPGSFGFASAPRT